MKYFTLFLLTIGLLVSGCKKDDPGIPPMLLNVLNYDGANLSAPLLDAGEHEAASRFTADDLDGYQGRLIEKVDFYLFDLPDFCEIRIYEGSSNAAPVNLIYSFDVSDSLTRESWNQHVLDPPVEILNDDLWIAVRMDAATNRNMIGCDPGPAVFNGDWMYTEFDNDWIPFVTRTSGFVNVNWNIRALLDVQ